MKRLPTKVAAAIVSAAMVMATMSIGAAPASADHGNNGHNSGGHNSGGGSGGTGSWSGYVAPNPSIPQSCGVDVTLVLDASGSISTSRAVGSVRSAGVAFLNALKNTKSTARVIQFADRSKVEQERIQVDDASMGPQGLLTAAMNRYYDQSVGRGTNWTAALTDSLNEQITVPQLVVFVTDGDPNGGGGMQAAVPVANNIKDNLGARIMSVGVGSAVTGSNSGSVTRLGQISGATAPDTRPRVVRDAQLTGITDLNQIDVALVQDFTKLGEYLRKLVSELCTPSVTIRKFAQSAGSATFEPAPGWNIEVAPTVPNGSFDWVLPNKAPAPSKDLVTDKDGFAQFQWEPTPSSATSRATIRETAKNGYPSGRTGQDNDWICDIRNPDNTDVDHASGDFSDPLNPSFALDITSRSIVTCALYNSFTETPGIQIAKAPAPSQDVVRSPADVVYTFTVTNSGNVPLAVVKPVDPRCDVVPMSDLISGDTNNNGKLDLDESFTYSCTGRVEAGQSSTAIESTNTVKVTGVSPGGLTVSATAVARVDVRTPALAIVKRAYRPDGSEIKVDPNDPAANKVPGGMQVTYRYTVTNVGNDPVRNPRISDDTCSPVTAVSGDTNSNDVIETTETWTFSCAVPLAPPAGSTSVTNTAIVSGTWSNPHNLPDNRAVTAQTTKKVDVTRAATLTIIKSSVPASSTDFGFTLSGDGVSSADTAFTLRTGGGTPNPSRSVSVEPQSGGSDYVITESGVTGWDRTGLVCTRTLADGSAGSPGTVDIGAGSATVRMAPGDRAICTYTNSRRPTVQISKQTSPNGDPQTFSFTATRPAPLAGPSPGSFSLADGGVQSFANLAPGNFTVSEDALPAGWAFDQLTCTGTSAQISGQQAVLALSYGDEAACVFSNEKLAPAKLSIVKTGTTVSPSPDFSFSASGLGLKSPGVQGTSDFTLTMGSSWDASVHPAQAGTTYTVTEGALPAPASGDSGWVRTAIVCSVNRGMPTVGDPSSGVATIALHPGDSGVCTFTNQVRPRLTITKNVVVGTGQTGANQTFDFVGTGTGMSDASLGNGQSKAYPNLTSGQKITVDETGVQGWVLTGLLCTGPGHERVTADIIGGIVEGTLQNGDDVSCVYTNTKSPSAPAVLTVVKQVDPAGAGTPAFPFTASGSRLVDADKSFSLTPGPSGSASRVITVVPDDLGSSYVLTEGALPSGWDLSGVSCSATSIASVAERKITLQLVPGDHVTCTFVNKPKAKLTVIKHVSVQPGQAGGDTQFAFSQTGLSAFGPLGHNGTKAFTGLDTGSPVSVTEAAVPGWSGSVSCEGVGKGHFVADNGALKVTAASPQPGDDVTCTFTNTKAPSAPASLTVVKQVSIAGAAPAFAFTAAGSRLSPADTSFTLTPDGTGSAKRTITVTPDDLGGVYTVTEGALPAGWDFDSVTCKKNGVASGSPGGTGIGVSMAPGDAVTCTFVNKPKAKFTVIKKVAVATGQTGADKTFAFTQTGLSAFGPLGNNGSKTFSALAKGTALSVTEPAVAGWSTTLLCTGEGSGRYTVAGSRVSGTTAPGDDVTCTYTNTKAPSAPASLTIVKSVLPKGAAPAFGFTASGTRLPGGDAAFSLTPDSSGTDSRSISVVPDEAGSTYTVAEAAQPAGWEFVSAACLKSGAPVGSVSGAGISVPLTPGDQVTCTFVNKPKAKLTILKRVSVQAGQAGADSTFAFTQTGLSNFTAPLGDGDTKTFPAVTAGTALSVTETAVTGWSTTVACTGTGAERYVVSGATVTAKAASGDDVTCVYTNTKAPSAPAVITVVKNVQPAGPAPAFLFTASGVRLNPADSSFGLTPGASGSASRTITVVPDDAGSSYSITEGALPSGWDFSALSCTRNGIVSGTVSGQGVTFKVVPGDKVTCNFVNKPKAKLTITKHVSVQTGQLGADQKFPFTQTGLTDFAAPLGDGDSKVFTDIAKGSAVSVTEPAVAGWATAVTCQGTGASHYTVTGRVVATTGAQSGDDVTCIYTNTKEPAKPAVLTVIKQLQPASDGPAFSFTLSPSNPDPSAAAFTIDPGVTGAGSKTLTLAPYDAGTTYTLAEEPRAGWDFFDVTCQKNNADVAGLSGPGIQLTLQPGDKATCTYVNKPKARLVVIKNESVGPGQVGGGTYHFDTSPSLAAGGFDLRDQDLVSYSGIAPNTAVSVEETDPGPEWITGVTCTGVGASRVQITGRRAESTMKSGDSVTCVYTNTKKPSDKALLSVVKHVNPAVDAPAANFAFSANHADPAAAGFSLDPDASGTDTRTFALTPFEAGAGGTTYTLSETAGPTGYDFAELTCAVNGAPHPTSGPSATLTLVPGDTAVCTYVNVPKAALTIEKSVSVGVGQSGAGSTFAFTQSGLTPFPSRLGDGDTKSFTQLTAGTPVSVTEQAVPGWTTNVVCSGAGSDHYTVTGQTVSGTTRSGDAVTCRYTNTKNPSKPAVLTVIKQVAPTQDAPSFGFNLSSGNPDPATGGFSLDPDAGGSARRTFTLAPYDAGTTYTVAESSPAAGWDFGSAVCTKNGAASGTASGTGIALSLSPGDQATCTFTNKPKAKLTIKKIVSVGVGQSGAGTTFPFTQTGLSAFGPLGNAAVHEFPNLTKGATVSVTEPAVAGWTTTVQCLGTGADHYSVSGPKVSGVTASGDDVTCVYTNSKNPSPPATLTVVKTVDPAQDSPAFPFQLSSATPDPAAGAFSLDPGATGTVSRTFTLAPFDAGTKYTVAEGALPAGWDFSRVSCVNNAAPAGTVSGPSVSLVLKPGDRATCSYLNKPEASLTIRKVVSVATGQTGGDAVFAFSQTGLDPIPDLGDGDAASFIRIARGKAVSVSEAAVPGWTTSVTCSGEGASHYAVSGRTVAGTTVPGDAVTCVYTNTKDPSQPATLTVTKQVDPAVDAPAFTYTVGSSNPDPAAGGFTLDPGATGSASVSRTLHPYDSGTTYTLTESALPAGWDFSGVTCVRNGAAAGTASGQGISLTVSPGDRVTCSYLNKPQAKLTVKKIVSVATGQTGANDVFDFTQTGLAAFGPLGNGASRTFTNLAKDTDVRIAETPVAGWSTAVSCTGQGAGRYTASGSVVTGTTAPGDDVTCIYTNTKDPSAAATLTVVKQVVPASSAPAFGFTLTSTDPDAGTGPFTLAPGANGSAATSVSLHPYDTGTTYRLAEGTLPAGWDFSALTCRVNGQAAGSLAGVRGVDLALAPGDRATCTFVNKPKAKLTIRKIVSVGTGQTGADKAFAFTQTGLPSDLGPLGNNGSKAYTGLTDGSAVTVTETAVADWNASVVCSGDGSDSYSAVGGALSGTPHSGDDVTCVFSNVKQALEPAVLVVGKLTVPVGSAERFGFTAAGTGLNAVGQPGSKTFTLPDQGVEQMVVHPVEVSGDEFTVTEAASAGWDRAIVACNRSSDPANIINGDLGTGVARVRLLPGEVGLCLYANVERGSLTIVKQTDTPSATAFPFTATGVAPATFSLTNGQSQKFSDLPANTEVTIGEQIPTTDPADRWYVGSIDCRSQNAPPSVTTDLATGRATVRVGAGENVTCTYLNKKVAPASITVVKNADPADGTAFAFTATGDGAVNGVASGDRSFTLTPKGGPDTRTLTVYPPLSGEKFTVAEVLSGDQAYRWDLIDMECQDGGASVGTRNGTAISVDLNPGDAVSCSIKNRKRASLTIAKSAPADPDQEFPFTWDVDPDSPDFILTDGSLISAFPIEPGTYSVNEVLGPLAANWSLAGGHPICTGTSAQPVLSGTGATVTVAPGEDAHCMFVNEYDYRPALQLTKSVDRDLILAGGSVTYSFALTNSGNTGLALPAGAANKAAAIVDNFCSPIVEAQGNGADDTLAPGETWHFTCAKSGLTQDTKNTATATMVDPISKKDLTSTDSVDVMVLKPAISINKMVDKAVIYAGTRVTYTYEVINTGEAPLVLGNGQTRDQVVADDKCASVTYLGGDAGDDEMLDTNEKWRFECAATLSSDTTNTATATMTPKLNGVTGAPVTDTDQQFVRVIKGDIAVKKTASAPGGVRRNGALAVAAGSTVTFTYEVTTGTADTPMKVLNAVSDDKCTPVTYVGGDTNKDGLIAVDETWTYTCSKVFGPGQDETNVAVVDAVEPLVGGTFNAVAREHVAAYSSRINIAKSASDWLVPPGSDVDYSYTVTNTGETPLGSVTVTDDKCSPVVFLGGDTNNDSFLDIDETWTFGCTANLSTSTENTAVVRGVNPFGIEVTSSAKANVLVVGQSGVVPGIGVTKVASKSVVSAGQPVTYTYAVTNTGSLALADVENRLTDDKCSPLVYVSGDLDGNDLLTSGKEIDGGFPNETWYYTCTTKLSATTTNTVVATGTPVSFGKVVAPDVKATAKATVSVKSSPSGGPTPTPSGSPSPSPDPSGGSGGGTVPGGGGGTVPGGGGSIPTTGSDVVSMVMAGLLALAGGIGGIVLARRRRDSLGR